MRGSANVKPIRVALVVAALALMPSEGLGWGRDGHQVIGNLAQSRLSPQARKGVAALLHGATLASVSTDADNYRNNHPETARWHDVNIPLGDGPYNPARDCAPSPQWDSTRCPGQRGSYSTRRTTPDSRPRG
jgi:hypothetical protein